MTAPAPAPALSCRALAVAYDGVPVVHGVDVEADAGETVAMLGPSGSGKTTLLYAVAGFVPVARGEIRLGGTLVAGADREAPPEDRDVGVVFQHYALWPHLAAEATVAYPLLRRGLGRAEARERARELLDLVGIPDLADRLPAQLSGGQQQRVGLARALARGASLYLLDEPTAHLDAPLRAALQAEIARARSETGAAALYATHDAQEALAIADRVVLLRDGQVAQEGTPEEVYCRPADRWAAELTGLASVLHVDVVATDSRGARLSVGTDVTTVASADGPVGLGTAAVLVRPEWARLGGPLPGRVERTAYRGPHTDHHVATPAGEVVVRVAGPPQVRVGDRVGWSLERVWILPDRR